MKKAPFVVVGRILHPHSLVPLTSKIDINKKSFFNNICNIHNIKKTKISFMSNGERGQYKSGGMNFVELHEMGTRHFDRDGSGSLHLPATYIIESDIAQAQMTLYYKSVSSDCMTIRYPFCHFRVVSNTSMKFLKYVIGLLTLDRSNDR